jgi:serine/threonine protein kinase
VKLETGNERQIPTEASALRRLAGVRGAPRLIATGYGGDFDALVTEPIGVPLRDTSLTPAEVIDLTQRLVQTLHEVHERGLVHGDVSPDNVVLHNGEPVLIDWGLALPLGTPIRFVGKRRFASARLLRSNELGDDVCVGPDDDFESALHTMDYLLRRDRRDRRVRGFENAMAAVRQEAEMLQKQLQQQQQFLHIAS